MTRTCHLSLWADVRWHWPLRYCSLYLVLLRVKLKGMASDLTSLLNFRSPFIVFFACVIIWSPPALRHRRWSGCLGVNFGGEGRALLTSELCCLHKLVLKRNTVMKCASFAKQFLNSFNSFSNLPVLNYFSVKKIQAWYWINELRHRHINYFCIHCFFLLI